MGKIQQDNLIGIRYYCFASFEVIFLAEIIAGKPRVLGAHSPLCPIPINPALVALLILMTTVAGHFIAA